jgi:hypothetical protein
MAVHGILLSGVLRKTVFTFLTRYLYPELLTASLYLAIWFDPYFLGEKGFQGLSIGLWLDFVFNHAQVGTSLTGLFFKPNSAKKKIAVGVVSAFYLLFVGGLSVALGSYLTAIVFIVLSVKRILDKEQSDLFKQVGYSFARVMVLLLAGLAGYLISRILPSPVDDIPTIEKGAEMVPAWGLIYFVSLHFFERWLEKRTEAQTPDKREKRSGQNKRVGKVT